MFRTKNESRETKAGISASTARLKRVAQSNELRRSDREELLSSRRRDDRPEFQSTVPSLSDEEIIKDIPNLPQIIQGLRDPSRDVIFSNISRLRQVVSLRKDPPFDEVIGLGGLSCLIDLLTCEDGSIVFEAAWCLTNIASGNFHQTTAVVQAGAIPRLILLLSSTDDRIRDQCIWALGNIAGESCDYRDMILNLGGLDKLLEIAVQPVMLYMLRNLSWTISNLCRGKNPPADFRIVSKALPVLANMLNFNDMDVNTDAAWSISFLSDDTEPKNPGEEDIDRIQTVINAGVVGRLVQLLTHTNISIKTPVLRTIGNLVSGTHTQTQVVINNNAVPGLLTLLSSSRRPIRREAAWAISNIAAGTHSQLQYLKDCNTFAILLQTLQAPNSTIQIKKEICWAICNAVCCNYQDITPHLLMVGWIPALLSLVEEQDTDLQLCALDTLRRMLEFGEDKRETVNILGTLRDVNIYAMTVEECDGTRILDAALSLPNYDVYLCALDILTRYLGCDLDEAPTRDGFEVTDSNSNTFITSNPFQVEESIGFHEHQQPHNGTYDF